MSLDPMNDLIRDGKRYQALREMILKCGAIDFGEAYLRLKVVGQCPTVEEFDAEVDAMRAHKAGGSTS